MFLTIVFTWPVVPVISSAFVQDPEYFLFSWLSSLPSAVELTKQPKPLQERNDISEGMLYVVGRKSCRAEKTLNFCLRLDILIPNLLLKSNYDKFIHRELGNILVYHVEFLIIFKIEFGKKITMASKLSTNRPHNLFLLALKPWRSCLCYSLSDVKIFPCFLKKSKTISHCFFSWSSKYNIQYCLKFVCLFFWQYQKIVRRYMSAQQLDGLEIISFHYVVCFKKENRVYLLWT